MIDLIIDTEIMDKKDVRDTEVDSSTAAGRAELDMRRIQEERERQGLPPD